MPLARVVASLGVSADASEDEVAAIMRSIAGLSAQSEDAQLWIHLLDWFTLEVERPPAHQSSDLGAIGFAAATWAVPREDTSWTVDRWARELGLRSDRQLVEEWLALYVTDYLGPRLSADGLLRAQPYDSPPLELPHG
jgi:hypothetical protein